MTLSEYSRPNRVGYQNNQSSPQVRVSIVSLPSPPPPQPPPAIGGGGGGVVGGQLAGAAATANSNNVALPKQQSFTNGLEHQTAPGFSTPVGGDRICFNYGKELYVYSYRGAKKVIMRIYVCVCLSIVYSALLILKDTAHTNRC